MVRPRQLSAASDDSGGTARNQELGSMYDYLAKIILLGPSGSGKSCLLHRFVKNEWRIVSSQTIGVEFASKIIRVGTGARRKRIKLQLWDTAGTERFRSVSRSYYRGAAGALLVYDLTSHSTFTALPSFVNDARALASPNLTLLLAGNKADLADTGTLIDTGPVSTSVGSMPSQFTPGSIGGSSNATMGLGTQLTASTAPNGREVGPEEASTWASKNNIPVSVEVSALSGDNVDEVFNRLARMILTKIELGEIDPDDPTSGIQYGDGGWQGDGDGASVKSGVTEDGARRRRKARRGWGLGLGGGTGMREWEEVFTLSGRGRRSAGCC
ncbi:GTP-binding protein ypt4 [Diplocarpon rosae]|nr:GTP-binding protein ypt4 [Diplocarpon rosae]